MVSIVCPLVVLLCTLVQGDRMDFKLFYISLLSLLLYPQLIQAQPPEPVLITTQPGDWQTWDIAPSEFGEGWMEGYALQYLPNGDDTVFELRLPFYCEIYGFNDQYTLPAEAGLPLHDIGFRILSDSNGDVFIGNEYEHVEELSNVSEVLSYARGWWGHGTNDLFYAAEDYRDTLSVLWYIHVGGVVMPLDTVQLYGEEVNLLYPGLSDEIDQPVGVWWRATDGSGIVRYRPMYEPVQDTLLLPDAEFWRASAVQDNEIYWCMRDFQVNMVEQLVWTREDSAWQPTDTLEVSSYPHHYLAGWGNTMDMGWYDMVVQSSIWVTQDSCEMLGWIEYDWDQYYVRSYPVEGMINKIRTGIPCVEISPGGPNYTRWIVWGDFDEIEDSTRLYAYAAEYRETDVPEHESGLPSGIVIGNPWPNPFNSTARLQFTLPTPSVVQISIYNILGRKIQTLVHQPYLSGTHHVIWNADGFPSGTYMAVFQCGNIRRTQKLVLIR